MRRRRDRRCERCCHLSTRAAGEERFVFSYENLLWKHGYINSGAEGAFQDLGSLGTVCLNLYVLYGEDIFPTLNIIYRVEVGLLIWHRNSP
jgi:hypothetical protein